MKDQNSEIYRRFVREKRLNGLFYGWIAGFWFGLGTWLLDAALLYQAHGDLPWAKLLIGLPFTIILGGLAGWLAVWLDSAIWGALIWMVTGVIFVWIASHVPFGGISWFLGLLKPELAGLDPFPFVESARMRMGLLYGVVGVLMAIGGGFELFFVEAATRNSTLIGRFIALLACIIIFFPIGLMVDNLINQSLRTPLVVIDDLIQMKREEIGGNISAKEAQQLGARALQPLEQLINRPYSLVLGHYDPISLSDPSVHLNFSGEWGMCTVVANTPMVCWSSEDRYLSRIACLVEGGTLQTCKLKRPAAPKPFPAELLAGLDPGSTRYAILDQRGSAVVVLAEDQFRHQVQCVLREAGDVLLDTCSESQREVIDGHRIQPTVTKPRLTPTATRLPLQGADFQPEAAIIDPQILDPPVLEDAPRYQLTLDIAEDLSSYQGTARVFFTNREDVPLEEIYFRLLPNGHGSYGNGSLSVQELSLNGQQAEAVYSGRDTVLKVVLPEPLDPGEKAQVSLEFSGDVPVDFGGSESPSGYGIFNLSEGVLALSGWYPILSVYDHQGWNLDPPSAIGDSVYSEAGFYTVDIDYPDFLALAATGVRVDEKRLDGRIQARFESGPARDFFLVAGPDFEVVNTTLGETQVNSYYLPGYRASGEQALQIAADSLEVFNTRFGPYPYRELDVIAAPMRGALGVEFPGIILIGLHLYDEPERPEFAVTIAHEVAHQWWYSTVGNDVFDEPWLDEALTTYSSGLYYEEKLGSTYQAGLESYWQDRYDRLLEQGLDDLVTESLSHFEHQAGPAAYGGVVYVKGALFFKALRDEIGDPAFFQALQNYYQTHLFGIARTPDLLDAFETAAGRDLSGFYQSWLYSKQ